MKSEVTELIINLKTWLLLPNISNKYGDKSVNFALHRPCDRYDSHKQRKISQPTKIVSKQESKKVHQQASKQANKQTSKQERTQGRRRSTKVNGISLNKKVPAE